MHRKTEPTIHDIARELKISASTVSRALQNNARISLKTRDKIKAMAESMGYQPNTMASNLRTKRSNEPEPHRAILTFSEHYVPPFSKQKRTSGYRPLTFALNFT